MKEAVLTSAQRNVFIHILERCDVQPKARLVEFRFEEPAATTLLGITKFNNAEDVACIFTLGTFGQHIYVCATDGDADEIAAFLAQIEIHNYASSPVCFSDTYCSPHPYLESKRIAGSVMLTPSTLPGLAGLGDAFPGKDRPIEFLLVVFLREHELRTKLDSGFEALLDLFEAESKDVISIDSKD